MACAALNLKRLKSPPPIGKEQQMLRLAMKRWVVLLIGPGRLFRRDSGSAHLFRRKLDSRSKHLTTPMQPTKRLGMKTILIVEDQDANLAAFCMVLTMNGYNVLPAKDEDAAIRLSQKHQGSIDLLVADIILPRTNGVQLAQQVMKMRHLPVLFV